MLLRRWSEGVRSVIAMAVRGGGGGVAAEEGKGGLFYSRGGSAGPSILPVIMCASQQCRHHTQRK